MSGDSVSVVEESQSRSAIAVLTSALTSVIQEKDKQVEELQLKLEDSALTLPSGVSTVIIGSGIIHGIVGVGWRGQLTDS